jgi:hypothetical protein
MAKDDQPINDGDSELFALRHDLAPLTKVRRQRIRISFQASTLDRAGIALACGIVGKGVLSLSVSKSKGVMLHWLLIGVTPLMGTISKKPVFQIGKRVFFSHMVSPLRLQ